MADLKKILGDAWKEGMTAEETLKALEEAQLPAKEEAGKTVSKELFDKTASELAEHKRKLKARLTEDEQAEQARKEMLDRMAALEKENGRMKQERSFLDGGYDQKTAASLASLLSEGDMDGFIRAQAAYMADAMTKKEAEMKESILRSAPQVQQSAEGAEPGDVAFARQIAKSAAENISAASSVIDSYK